MDFQEINISCTMKSLINSNKNYKFQFANFRLRMLKYGHNEYLKMGRWKCKRHEKMLKKIVMEGRLKSMKTKRRKDNDTKDD